MKKILYLEDEPDEILMVKTRVESQGYSLVSAADGEEGLKKVREEKPDLILLDIIMPRMNGHEFCCHLKMDPATRNIPVIIITASGAKDLEKKCQKLGIQEIVHKPYESSYLLERIAFFLGE
ncbi:MAG: response regulator [Candidatus Omnitrophica bacterium]|nr:response regulator [Candidatus Omnitrophota bacterium]